MLAVRRFGMAEDRRLGDVFVPAEAAVDHSGRAKQLRLHHAAQAHSHDRLDDQLKPDERLAGIGVGRSGRAARNERFGGPIGQAGRMRQHMPGGDAFEIRIITQIRRPAIGDERLVEVETLFIDQLHHGIGEDRFGHRRGFEQCVLAHRVAGEDVFHAEARVQASFPRSTTAMAAPGTPAIRIRRGRSRTRSSDGIQSALSFEHLADVKAPAGTAPLAINAADPTSNVRRPIMDPDAFIFGRRRANSLGRPPASYNAAPPSL